MTWSTVEQIAFIAITALVYTSSNAVSSGKMKAIWKDESEALGLDWKPWIFGLFWGLMNPLQVGYAFLYFQNSNGVTVNNDHYIANSILFLAEWLFTYMWSSIYFNRDKRSKKAAFGLTVLGIFGCSLAQVILVGLDMDGGDEALDISFAFKVAYTVGLIFPVSVQGMVINVKKIVYNSYTEVMNA